MRRPADTRRGHRRPGRRGAVVGCVLSLLAVAPVARAAAAPAAAVPAGDVEDQPVRYHPSSAATGQPAPAAQATGDLTHVVAALAIVVGLVFGLRWVARRMSLVAPAGKSGRGVRLLSRTVLSPKQQVMLLHVGRRVIVVGDSGTSGMRRLAEITDADEVAALIGDARTATAAALPPARSFAALFRRAAEPFGGKAAGPDDVGPALAAPGRDAGLPSIPSSIASSGASSDVVGLLDKVRGLKRQFDR